jgi:uncharacterized membrane protein
MKHKTNAFWVFVALPLLATEANAYRLQCSGTEPFWGIQVEEKSIAVNLGVDKSVRYFGLKTRESAGMSAGYSFKIEASRGRGAQRVSLAILRDSADQCSDGMSDRAYPYHIQADVDGMLLTGCCSISETK